MKNERLILLMQLIGEAQETLPIKKHLGSASYLFWAELTEIGEQRVFDETLDQAEFEKRYEKATLPEETQG